MTSCPPPCSHASTACVTAGSTAGPWAADVDGWFGRIVMSGALRVGHPCTPSTTSEPTSSPPAASAAALTGGLFHGRTGDRSSGADEAAVSIAYGDGG